jgi:hypothetical protein
MVEKSIDLCSMNGFDAASAVVSKLYDPFGVELRVGSIALEKLTNVTHDLKDGWPVVSGENDRGETVTFQFSPDETPFRQSAVDADGQLMCPQQVA